MGCCSPWWPSSCAQADFLPRGNPTGLIGIGLDATPVLSTEREYIPADCPADTIVIPGTDVSRIDVSDGLIEHAGLGGLGFVIGAIATPFARDGWDLANSIVGGLAGALIGYVISPGRDEEIWRQIR